MAGSIVLYCCSSSSSSSTFCAEPHQRCPAQAHSKTAWWAAFFCVAQAAAAAAAPFVLSRIRAASALPVPGAQQDCMVGSIVLRSNSSSSSSSTFCAEPHQRCLAQAHSKAAWRAALFCIAAAAAAAAPFVLSRISAAWPRRTARLHGGQHCSVLQPQQQQQQHLLR
jgi:hypothetical protein